MKHRGIRYAIRIGIAREQWRVANGPSGPRRRFAPRQFPRRLPNKEVSRLPVISSPTPSLMMTIQQKTTRRLCFAWIGLGIRRRQCLGRHALNFAMPVWSTARVIGGERRGHLSATGHKRTHAPHQAASLTRLSRPITICQHAAKAIPLIFDADRAEIAETDHVDCDGTRFAVRPFWRMPKPVLRSGAFPSEGPSIRE